MNNLFAFLPMQSSNDLIGDPEALRERLDRDSYLYFEQLIDPERIREVRRDVLKALGALGWTNADEFPLTGQATIDPLREEDETFKEGLQAIQRLRSFHELAHEERLTEVMRQTLGPTAFPHPLKIARVAFPDHYEVSTPPHQDWPNNQGTERLTAAWIPLSDIPAELGGLAVLRGSHRHGLLPMAGHIGAGNRTSTIPDEMAEACRWVTTEFRQGDVLLFPSLTVHAALHNASVYDLRLSVDYRFQLEGEALTPGCLLPHFQRLTWEEIYAGWDEPGHEYYWKDLDYEVVPFEDIPVLGADGTADLREDDIKAILQFERRLRGRLARKRPADAPEAPDTSAR